MIYMKANEKLQYDSEKITILNEFQQIWTKIFLPQIVSKTIFRANSFYFMVMTIWLTLYALFYLIKFDSKTIIAHTSQWILGKITRCGSRMIE